MTEPRHVGPRNRLIPTDIPPQRRSAFALRQEAARRCRGLAYEAESQDSGMSTLAPLFLHLERLFSASPASVPNQDMARLAAILLEEPPPSSPEPITDGIQMREPRR